jgi:ankyrin repeat protein
VLRHCLPASIRETLNQLPKSLDDTYLRVLSQIPQANQAHAHRMLQCLVVAVRPLSVAELAELLAFEFDAAPGGIPKYRPALRLGDMTQAVLSTCSSLVTIVNDDSGWYRPSSHRRKVVHFSHFSVKEFLVSHRLALGDISRYHVRLASAHTTLTQACLGSLVHPDDHITKEIVQHSLLAHYAAVHWVEHAQFEDVACRVKDGIEALFDPEKPHFEAWIRTYDLDLEGSRRYNSELHNPLYYSVLCGFYDLVNHIAIKHPQYVNAFGGKYAFPLLAALFQGRVEVADLLLEHGADVNVREAKGKTTLLTALSWLGDHPNLLNTVEFLLTHGADVNARDYTFTSSLHLAEGRSNQQVATILLKHKADVNSEDNNGWTPLHKLLGSRMYYDDDPNHVQSLLDHGADVNRRDKANETPLHLAIRWDRFKLAGTLLEHGADAISGNNEDKTPLHILSESWIDDEGDILNLVLLLLKHGAEVNRRDRDNETPLHLAIRRNRLKLAGILLEHGADADTEKDEVVAPLYILSESSIEEEGDILKLAMLLLEHGADVNRRDNANETPLHLAIRRNRFKLAGALLENSADAIAVNSKGQTPLHTLSEGQVYDEGDTLKLAVLLLNQDGVEVNKRDRDGETPLHLAMRWDRFVLAGTLLENGADTNAENNEGKTPFHILSESAGIKDEDDTLKLALLLLKYGGKVNKQDEAKETSLHLAIRRNLFKLAGALLGHGADAIAVNTKGQTPLHTLSEGQVYDEGDTLKLAVLLLNPDGASVNLEASGVVEDWSPTGITGPECQAECPGMALNDSQCYRFSADVNRRDSDGETPLHLAMRWDRFMLAGTLLEHGADTNAENNEGKTPFHILSESADIKEEGDILNLVQLLLKYGADVNRRDKNKDTPLHLAIFRDRLMLAGALLKNGADTKAENNDGLTPLHILSETWINDKRDLLHLALLLLNHCADVNRRNKNNETPLHLAIRENRLELAGILLEHGADANAENNNRKTPLQMLSESWGHGKGDFINRAGLLLVHGVGANCQDEDNQTSLLLLGKGKAGGITGNRFTKIINELGTDPSTDNNLILGDISVQQVRQGHYGSRKRGLGFALQSLVCGDVLNVQGRTK